jgi:peptidoglycan/xylan/chitin deacetylase (PgdA/CDA1 family)
MNKALVYHTISRHETPLPSGIDISPERFESHLAWLSDRREKVVALDKFLSVPESEGLVAITFDDGFRDNLTVALPLLEKYRLPMTLFMVAGYIGSDGYLDADELREIARHPLVTVGSHGLWHRPFTVLSDTEAAYELSESKERIEDAIGKRVTLMAYPYGDCNSRIERLCEASGYSAAWSVWNGNNTPFSRWRVPLGTHDNLTRLKAKLSSVYFPLKRMVKPPRIEQIHESAVLQSHG